MIATKEKSIREELDLLAKKDKLNAEAVYDYAKDNPDSLLHARFNWDVKEAAYQHNLKLARDLIQEYKWTYVTKEKETVVTRRWVNLPTDEGNYRRIEDVLSDKANRAIFLNMATQELFNWRNRFITLEKELKPIFEAIDKL